MIFPVVLCGGSGTRLWPLSRSLFPKQFHRIVDLEQSLLQATCRRLWGLDGAAPGMVICNDDHRFMVAEQLRAMGEDRHRLVLEPVGRNTAPAVAAAAIERLAAGEDPVLLVLPSDHVILDESTFHRAVSTAASVAARGHLVTFGVIPSAPDTGFGYIRGAASIDTAGDGEVFEVDAFVEKPDAATAEGYLDAGGYYWNSGMFLFQASRYLEELERRRPRMVEHVRAALERATRDLDFLRLDRDSFAAVEGDSIDYAVMEHAEHRAMVVLDAGWSDVGSWTGLWDILDKDESGNAAVGDVLLEDVRNSYCRSDGRLIAVAGLDGVVVVETADAILVASRERAQEVKAVVERLKGQGRVEADVHKQVYRPWGAFQGIDLGERFQAKRLTLIPGAKISLQRHRHRSEHWVVVRGRARVRRGEETLELGPDQSTYIPVGTVHQLENIGAEPLEVIEVQTGDYFGEDDIERFEDAYGRA